jgi:SNF2 family DNA or RNA helicase
MCREQITRDNMVVINDNVTRKHDDRKTKIEQMMSIIDSVKNGKFLAFSAYDMSFKHITKELTQNKITHRRLNGNASVISKVIEDFNIGTTQVLLLNPKSYGCGLNLEKTTDIIFYHKFSIEMERQIIGRAQRYGRNTQLRIHYLYYENEFIDAPLI